MGEQLYMFTSQEGPMVLPTRLQASAAAQPYKGPYRAAPGAWPSMGLGG